MISGGATRTLRRRCGNGAKPSGKPTGSTPAEVRDQFPNASILRNNRVVFRIRGNNYRLVAVVFYAGREVYIRFIGTHAEYNRINANEV